MQDKGGSEPRIEAVMRRENRTRPEVSPVVQAVQPED